MGRQALAGAGLVLIGVLLLARPIHALSLQEIITTAKRSVVHLSIVDADGEEPSSGTGFVISSEGHVATNFHVVDDATHGPCRADLGVKVHIVSFGWAGSTSTSIAADP